MAAPVHSPVEVFDVMKEFLARIERKHPVVVGADPDRLFAVFEKSADEAILDRAAVDITVVHHLKGVQGFVVPGEHVVAVGPNGPIAALEERPRLDIGAYQLDGLVSLDQRPAIGQAVAVHLGRIIGPGLKP